MQKFQRNTIPAQPWKNGGGKTREIARSRPAEPYWRLSIADVAQDGPFSRFEGLSRLLTVIEGNGLTLESADRKYRIDYLVPFAFEGEAEFTATLTEGPIQNFNLIYDKAEWVASVRVDCPKNLQLLRTELPSLTALFCVKGYVDFEEIEQLKMAEGFVCRDFRGQVFGPKDGLALRLDLWVKH